jgi:hypothetical protein
MSRAVICKDRNELSSLLLNISERYEIESIEVIDAEFGSDYSEFCLPKIN